MRFLRKTRFHGVSIIEVLVSLGIFSLAVAGMFFAMNSITQGVAVTMRRDVESAFANMLLAQINPHDQYVETAYDKDSSEASCGNSRCYVDIPNSSGQTSSDRVYYTIQVNSDWNVANTPSEPATADVKNISLYLYRNATTNTPYRQFKREIAPDIMAWKMGGPAYYRDVTGLLWTRIATCATATCQYSTTGGSIRAGIDAAATTGGAPSVVTTATDPTNAAVDPTLWKSAWEPGGAGTSFGFAFPATQNRRYVVEIGLNEFDATVTAAGQRVFNVYINGALTDTVDIYSLAGGNNKVYTKSYTVVPLNDASGVPLIKVGFQQNGGTKKPRVCWIRLRRN
ncbi:MAG TPA: malectin domain-containing carbohydrate-binding protein [Oculatellaceae cyanobacterium]|jgi:type II secretory pathway pseudopilin PulG